MTTVHAIRHLSKGEKVNGDPNIGSVLEKAANEIESLTIAKERLREELMYARALLQDQYCDLTSINKALKETE